METRPTLTRSKSNESERFDIALETSDVTSDSLQYLFPRIFKIQKICLFEDCTAKFSVQDFFPM